jgi:MaoC like domain
MTGVGTKLPVWELPITPTLVVSTAIATRDYQDVHHDRDLAQSHGSKDIFVNILATTGLVQKYVGDWAREAIGPDFVVRSCALRLGGPAHPYDTLSFSGKVTEDTDGVLTIEVFGQAVPQGSARAVTHVTATVGVKR